MTKINLPLFRVELTPKDNNSEILDLTALLYTKVKIELPRKSREIPQCKRCQGIGHSQNYCYRAPKCVKCGEGHLSNTCQKPKEASGRCANCKGEHTANYKGCPKFQERITSQRQLKINIIDRMKMNSLVDPTLTFADKAQSGPSSTNLSRAKNVPVAAASQTNKLSVARLPATCRSENSPPSQPKIAPTPDLATLISNLQASLQKGLDELNARMDRLEVAKEEPSPPRKYRKND